MSTEDKKVWQVICLIGGNEVVQSIERQNFDVGVTMTLFYNVNQDHRSDPVFIPNSQIVRIETAQLVTIPDDASGLANG